MASEQPAQPWYSQTWVAVVALVLFFPVGLFLMWRFTRWELWVKSVVSVVISLFLILVVVSVAIGGDETDDEVVREEATPSPTVEAATPTPEPTEPMIDTAATATAEAEEAAAATATAEAEQQASTGESRDNPVPTGQPHILSEGWEMTVVDFIPDATQTVLTENQFNDPPDPGFKYVIVRVRATNISAGDPADFDASFALRLVGSRNVSYDQFTRSCGVIPDEFGLDAPSEAFTGGTVEGNVCFHVGADETGFVMFTEFFLEEDAAYFSVE